MDLILTRMILGRWMSSMRLLLHQLYLVTVEYLFTPPPEGLIKKCLIMSKQALLEAEANKAAGKYNNVSIDNQIDLYKEGLTPYSKAKLPITSDVPGGCVIIREHIPIRNLFTCLWFNEVDCFTSRDQLSFSIVRDKMAKSNWTINMFLDCEGRNFVIQAYHRDLPERRPPPLP